MVDFFDLCDSSAESGAFRLEEARVGDEPLACLLFTSDSDLVAMHYEKDQAVMSYVLCPGDGCPVCRLGSRAKEFILVPVLDLAVGAVKVLRVSTRRGPTTLFDQLRPHMKLADSSDRLVLVERDVATYSVTSEQLGPAADRGESAIKAYLERRKNGLQLASAFTSMTAEELSNVARVRKLLDARGIRLPSDPQE